MFNKPLYGDKPGILMFADFQGLNIPTMADFKNTELGRSADSSQVPAHHWLWRPGNNMKDAMTEVLCEK